MTSATGTTTTTTTVIIATLKTVPTIDSDDSDGDSEVDAKPGLDGFLWVKLMGRDIVVFNPK